MFGIVYTLSTASPGAVPAAVGIFAMEEGSLFFNLWSVDIALCEFPTFLAVWPRFERHPQKKLFLNWMYYSMNSLSNALAVYFVWKAAIVSFKEGYTGFGMAGVILVIPMAAIRQIDVFTSKKSGLALVK